MKKKAPPTPPATDMLIDERRRHLLARIQTEGRLLVGEVSDEIGVSRITIRKDLDALQSRGLIQRTHGGALSLKGGVAADPALSEKDKLHQKEKERIAGAAVELVEEGQCVILDSGTTTSAIGRALRRLQRLTVITNAINIAADLSGTDFEIILTGGNLRKNSSSLVGPFAEEVLREIHGDILFLGVDGFDPRIGVTTPNVLESRVNRAMVKAANRVVVVCDSTKFDRHSLALIVAPQEIDTVITDTGLSGRNRELLESAGIQVMTV